MAKTISGVRPLIGSGEWGAERIVCGPSLTLR